METLLHQFVFSFLLIALIHGGTAQDVQPVQFCNNRAIGYYSYPGNCGKFISCNGKSSFSTDCPKNSPNFNPTLKVCDALYRCPSVSTTQRQVTVALSIGDIANAVLADLENIMDESRQITASALRAEVAATRDMTIGTRRRRVERISAFRKVQSFLGSSKLLKRNSIPAADQLGVLRIAKTRFGVAANDIGKLILLLPAFLRPNPTPAGPDMPNLVATPGTCPYPTNNQNNHCNPYTKYRTIDGSCNNLWRPLWGKSNRPLARHLPPDYADGIGEPRASVSGNPLPSVRKISLELFTDADNPSHLVTTMHMRFGQFLDHDLDRTAIAKLTTTEDGSGPTMDVTCGDDGCSTEGEENRACFPIPIPDGDPDFGDQKCLMFVRTEEGLLDNCRLSPREQINQITSWIDASNVYGSTKEMADDLRDFSDSSRGRLRTQQHPYDNTLKYLLPTNNVPACRDLNETIRCFKAGDGRLNEHTGLASLHTVFMREHNRMEDELHKINPHWSGERLYQEVRAIMAAIMQYISYNEYVPSVVGPDLVKKYGLGLSIHGYYTGYNPLVSPDISNAFATAAFRFGHSQISNFLKLTNSMYNQDLFEKDSLFNHRPRAAYDTNLPGGSGIDALMLGHVAHPAQDPDRHFAKQVSAHLFSENPPDVPGTDLPSLNTQRGRDHGLPGYVAWRKWCDLSVPKSFAELTDIPEDAKAKLEMLYEDVADIDLFAGGISERLLAGALVGPTFGCINARQFHDVRVSDRFWHEREDGVVGLRPDQLNEIRKSSLSRVLCDNLDHIKKIQRWSFLRPFPEALKGISKAASKDLYSLLALYQGDVNYIRPCAYIPSVDLNKWKDYQK